MEVSVITLRHNDDDNDDDQATDRLYRFTSEASTSLLIWRWNSMSADYGKSFHKVIDV